MPERGGGAWGEDIEPKGKEAGQGGEGAGK